MKVPQILQDYLLLIVGNTLLRKALSQNILTKIIFNFDSVVVLICAQYQIAKYLKRIWKTLFRKNLNVFTDKQTGNFCITSQ